MDPSRIQNHDKTQAQNHHPYWFRGLERDRRTKRKCTLDPCVHPNRTVKGETHGSAGSRGKDIAVLKERSGKKRHERQQNVEHHGRNREDRSIDSSTLESVPGTLRPTNPNKKNQKQKKEATKGMGKGNDRSMIDGDPNGRNKEKSSFFGKEHGGMEQRGIPFETTRTCSAATDHHPTTNANLHPSW